MVKWLELRKGGTRVPGPRKDSAASNGIIIDKGDNSAVFSKTYPQNIVAQHVKKPH